MKKNVNENKVIIVDAGILMPYELEILDDLSTIDYNQITENLIEFYKNYKVLNKAGIYFLGTKEERNNFDKGLSYFSKKINKFTNIDNLGDSLEIKIINAIELISKKEEINDISNIIYISNKEDRICVANNIGVTTLYNTGYENLVNPENEHSKVKILEGFYY
ncbi:MAG: hypothetical protein ACK5HP_02770 [Bacilli bacterium]